jgi:ABC-type bacteriocin/lantibiotic exporter with double-glycine peptidase domain
MRRRKVPFVLQMTTSECGVACLAMILRYHGHHMTLSECRREVPVGRDGVTAGRLASAARRLGLETRAYVTNPAGCSQLELPAVAHWEDAHFVVLERVGDTAVDLVDPAVGRRRLSTAEFADGFGGLVLTFAPGRGFRPRPRVRSRTASVRLLHTAVARRRRMLAIALATSLVLQLLGLALPIATGVAIDRVIAPRNGDLLSLLAVGTAVLGAAQLLAGHLRARVLVALQVRVHGEVTRGVFGHLLSLPYEFFEQRANGDLIQRLTSTGIVRELVTTQVIAAVLDGALMLVYLALLLAADTALGAVAAGFGAAEAALLLATRGRIHRLQQRHLLAQAKANGLVFETLAGIATVKAMGAEERVLKHWNHRFGDELTLDARQSRLIAVVENAAAALRLLAPLTLVLLGAHRVLNGTLSVGEMVALLTLAGAFLNPLGSLVQNAQRLQSARAHLERLTDVLDTTPEQPGAPSGATPRPSGKVELQSVDFRYDSASPRVLRNISVTIEAGQNVALVGPSGSGKSTLAMLLLGLHAPTAGNVLYDGVPLHALDRGAVRSQFGVVLQEPFVLGDSIRNNITGRASLPEERVRRAAGIAALDHEIATMPMGYETRLGDGGAGLSGGQRQRLALARAVASDPALLLLDEATSHLDVLTEGRVYANLDQLRCTRIVIAHRVSTVRNADLILVLDNGELVERGRHDELLARDGLYRRLVSGDSAEAAPWSQELVA